MPGGYPRGVTLPPGGSLGPAVGNRGAPEAVFGSGRAILGGPMQRFSRAFAGLLFTIVVGGIVVGICLAALLPSLGIITSAADYKVELVTDLTDLSERSTVYDASGTEMGQLGLENRQNVTLDQVPQVLIDAGVKMIVHPGGSKRDQDTFDLCAQQGVVCMTTGIRHFRH